MDRGINKLIAAIIIIWIAVFIFQKEILSFIGSWGPSTIKDILLGIINFMVYWAGRAWDLVKYVFNWAISLAAKLISNAGPLYGLIKWLTEALVNIIKWILSILPPIVGKVLVK